MKKTDRAAIFYPASNRKQEKIPVKPECRNPDIGTGNNMPLSLLIAGKSSFMTYYKETLENVTLFCS